MAKPTDMNYRSLGRCGAKVSQLSLGGWTTFGQSIMDQLEVRDILYAAFEHGINFFDIADVYGQGEAENLMGATLREFPRNELVISSKCFFPMSEEINNKGLSRKHIMESVHQSLKRIGTDYLDLYFCHRFDPETPLEETVRAMDDLVHQGKVLYWGTSSWTGEQIRTAHRICDKFNAYHPQVEQPRYNLINRDRVEKDVRPASLEHGMGIVTYSPLSFGFLTGKYDSGIPAGSRMQSLEWLQEGLFLEHNFERVRRMKSIADRLGCTRAQLAIAWVAAQPGISSVITGATSVNQLEENLKAIQVPMTEDVKAELEKLFPLP